MIKITLPTSETLPNSQFFTKITQASTRGDLLVYNDDYTQATLELSTDAFFTIEDAKNIVNAGGEVEGYPYWIRVKKTDFENTQIPAALADYLNSTKEGIEVVTGTPSSTYKDVFKFTKEVDGDYIEYLNSANSELLPMSVVMKIV